LPVLELSSNELKIVRHFATQLTKPATNTL